MWPRIAFQQGLMQLEHRLFHVIPVHSGPHEPQSNTEEEARLKF